MYQPYLLPRDGEPFDYESLYLITHQSLEKVICSSAGLGSVNTSYIFALPSNLYLLVKVHDYRKGNQNTMCLKECRLKSDTETASLFSVSRCRCYLTRAESIMTCSCLASQPSINIHFLLCIMPHRSYFLLITLSIG